MVTVQLISQCDFTNRQHGIFIVASFTKEVKPRLAKRPLVFNGRLANRGLNSVAKVAAAAVACVNPVVTEPGSLLPTRVL